MSEEERKNKIETFNEDIPITAGGDTPGDVFDVWCGSVLGILGLYAMMLGHPIYGSIEVGIAITYVGKLFVWDTLLANYVERIRIKWTQSNQQAMTTSPKSGDALTPTPTSSPSTPPPSESSSG